MTILSDTTTLSLATLNPFLYRSYLYDSETGLYYLQSRYYDPEIGRFINADEPTFIGMSNSISSYISYGYCDADPVNKVDKDGLFALTTTLLYACCAALTALATATTLATMEPITVRIPFDFPSIWDIPTHDFGDVVLPKVEPESNSKSILKTEAAEADRNIRRRVRRNSASRYWAARRVKRVVIITRSLVYPYAVIRVRGGLDVFTVTRIEAKQLAKAAGGHIKPTQYEIDTGKENTLGYYWHYHTYNRSGGHVFYLF